MALGMAGTESVDLQPWSSIHAWGDILFLAKEPDESREHLHLHLAQYTCNGSQILITYM